MAFEFYQPNPRGLDVGDCTVRALSRALDLDWDRAYLRLCAEGFALKDMPSANMTWGSLLYNKGFRRHYVSDGCPSCMTVEQFTQEHPNDLYVLALEGHVVCADHGRFCDSFDSGKRPVKHYWIKEDRR